MDIFYSGIHDVTSSTSIFSKHDTWHFQDQLRIFQLFQNPCRSSGVELLDCWDSKIEGLHTTQHPQRSYAVCVMCSPVYVFICFLNISQVWWRFESPLCPGTQLPIRAQAKLEEVEQRRREHLELLNGCGLCCYRIPRQRAQVNDEVNDFVLHFTSVSTLDLLPPKWFCFT